MVFQSSGGSALSGNMLGEAWWALYASSHFFSKNP